MIPWLSQLLEGLFYYRRKGTLEIVYAVASFHTWGNWAREKVLLFGKQVGSVAFIYSSGGCLSGPSAGSQMLFWVLEMHASSAVTDVT